MPMDYRESARIAYLSWLAAEDAEAETWLRTLREYARGEQRTFLTERQKEFIGLTAKNTNYLYQHNLCGLIIDTVVERLKLTGFAGVEGDTGGRVLATAAQSWWEANRMDAVQDDLYEAACRDSEAYLIVDWSPAGLPRWTLNPAYDGTQGVKMHRDPTTGEAVFASKRWQLYDPLEPQRSGRTRLNLYFPDRTEKYLSARDGTGIGGNLGGVPMRTGWEEWRDPGDTKWPIPWVDGDGVSLGLPVVAFRNPGGSEIDDVVSLQDLLNKSDLDLIAGADTSGFRILYASGVAADIDATTGKETAVTVSPGHLMRLTDPAARLGAIEGADLTRMIETCRYWIECIAALSRTPQYLLKAIGADQPSGESLRMQELGLISKCQRKHGVFGNAWEDVVYLSARLAATYGGEQYAGRLQAQWQPVGTRDELREAQIVQADTGAGMPLATALREDRGWSQEQIDQMEADKKAEAAADKATAAVAMLDALRRLDAGEGAVPEQQGEKTAQGGARAT